LRVVLGAVLLAVSVSPGLSQITSGRVTRTTNTARQIQLGIKLLF